LAGPKITKCPPGFAQGYVPVGRSFIELLEGVGVADDLKNETTGSQKPAFMKADRKGVFRDGD